MHAPVLTAPPTIDALEHLYQFRDPDEVRAYLAQNLDLIELLVGAAAKIPEFLPNAERPALEVVRDPEEEHDGGDLVAVVVTDMDPDEVRPRLRRLDREWLIAAGRFAVGRFNVAVEYR